MHIPILETPRLLLRPLSLTDAYDVFQWVSDQRVTKFMPYNPYLSIDEVEKWLSTVIKDETTYNFGFVIKTTNTLIGSGDIGYNNEKDTWDLGYNIHYNYWNQGFATEATKAMINFAHNTFDAKWFTASFATDNPASGRVMEKCKLKYDYDGTYSKFDHSETFQAKFYRGFINKILL